MKIFKYAFALLAIMATAVTLSSCSKDVDPDVEAKQNYWMEFTLSNPGSLPSISTTYKKATYSGTEFFNLMFNLEIYGIEGKISELTCNPLYCTESYAWNNWNKLLTIADKDNDVIQKVMKPVAKAAGGVRDFEVTVTFSKDEQQTVLGTKTWKAADVLSAADVQ